MKHASVPLTFAEVVSAANAGVMRNVTAYRDSRPLENGRNDAGFESHVLGAIGELATAKYLGAFWSPAVGVLDTWEGDVASAGVHVKASVRDKPCLILRPPRDDGRERDPAHFPYVLAVLELRIPRAILAGWCYGHDGRTPDNWRDVDRARGVHQAAWFVPQSALRPLPELRDVLALGVAA